MMAQARGSAIVLVAMVVMVVVIGQCEAATYTVGGGGGWTFSVDSWPRGKRFRAGDTLVFNYNSGIHNVVPVNKRGYDGCTTSPSNARVFQTGRDQIRLARGQNYFICTVAGHCQSGMKIAINAV